MGKLRDEGMVVGFKAIEGARKLLLVWQEPEEYSPDSWWRASDASTHELTQIDCVCREERLEGTCHQHVTLGSMQPCVCVWVCVCVRERERERERESA